MTRPALGMPLVPLALLLLMMGGCKGAPSAAPLSQQQEQAMRRPVGSNPMPPEAARAMQNANQKARQQATQPGGK